MWNRLVVAVVTAVGLAGGCQGPWFDLDPWEIRTVPEPEQALPGGVPLEIHFSREPDRASAEGLVRVTAEGTTVTGDFRWEGPVLKFIPVPELDAGTRYVLGLNGTLEFPGGRTGQVRRTIPFQVSGGPGPGWVTQTEPRSGASAGTSAPLSVTFNRPVGQEEFVRCFALVPQVPAAESWSADRRQVTLVPRGRWEPLGLQSWKWVSGHRVDTGAFLVNVDQTTPGVTSVVLGNRSGTDGPVVVLTFTEPVVPRTLEAAFRLTPAVPGRFIGQDPATFVFVPGEEFTPGQTYILRLSPELEDLSGNCLAQPWTVNLTPLPPRPRVVDITLTGNSSLVSPGCPPPDGLPVLGLSPGPGPLVVQVRFDRDVPPEARSRPSDWGRCTALFPADLGDPVLASVSWEDPRTVVAAYRNLSAGPDGSRPHLYQFLVPRGPACGEAAWINFTAGS